MSEIFVYSIYHFIFILGVLFIWRFIDTKYDYSRYLKITLIVGVIGAIIYDLVGAVLFNFWGYYSSNILEYLAITASTYIAGTVLFIEVINFLINKFSLINLGYKFNVTNNIKWTLLFLTALSGLIITALKITDGINTTWLFIASIFAILVVGGDMLVNLMVGAKGPFLRLLDGEIFSLFAITISGVICGFIWELFNQSLPMWYYQDTLPNQTLAGVPLVVVVFWGALTYGYWALAQILFQSYRLKN